MSLLIYRGINLQIVHTRQISRTVLTSRDGMAYHGTHWRFDVDCQVNPGATAYLQPGNAAPVNLGGGVQLPVAPTNMNLAPGSGNPFPGIRAAPGTLPVFTEASLRYWLQQPRGQLVYAIGGVLQTQPPPTVLFQCPAPGYACDLTGQGPSVKVNQITQHGERTFTLALVIECVVNESTQSVVGGKQVGAPLGFPVLLSNRWRQSMDQDDEHFVSVTTQGEATFRLDELARRGTTPDQYRNYVGPNCPANFHRGPIRTVTVEGGSTLLYEFTDQELAFNTPTRFGATRLEVYETRQIVHPNVGAALGIGLSYVLQPSPYLERGGRESAGHFAARQSAARREAVGAAVSTAISIGRAVLPVVVRSSMARAWGNRNSARANLANFAVGAALARVGQGDEWDSTQARLTQECSGKFVEFEITHTRVWIPGNLLNANAGLAVDGITPDTVLRNVTRVRASDDTTGFLQRADAQNLQPPNSLTPGSSGTRGTYTGVLQPTTPAVPPGPGLPAPQPTPLAVVDLLP